MPTAQMCTTFLMFAYGKDFNWKQQLETIQTTGNKTRDTEILKMENPHLLLNKTKI